MTPVPEVARAAFDRRAWSEAVTAFASVEELGREDSERLAVAAYLIGADEVCERAWEAAHRAALAAGDPAEAARYSFWLGLCLLLRGQMAQAGGWLKRSETIIAEAEVDCAASGYLLVPALLGALQGGDAAGARDLASEAVAIGRRLEDADLRAFGLLGVGQALLAMGDSAEGTARLDEVMVSVVAGEVGPIATGIVYCAVILECMALLDLGRAAEWTRALSDWCDSQPDLVPYRGQCLVHRSQLQTAAGEWSDAGLTIDVALRRLTDPPHPALGLAYYQDGELHRLLGAIEAADASYRLASLHGHDPVPGRALLEQVRGDVDAAAVTIRRAMSETPSPSILAAAVDILRAAGDFTGARAAADELSTWAINAKSDVLDAMAAQARGSVLVGEGDPVAGLVELRNAARAWQTLRMPYEAARTATLLGLACAAFGDQAAAALEFDNARLLFTELGARPDLARLDALTGPPSKPDETVAGLSAREREVLLQLASGKTNREIATELHISQHTAGRHIENIFTKLGVKSRAAATARAYELGLIER